MISLHIQPRASKTEVVGLHGTAIKIRLKAPPVDGAANDELTRFLAEQLHVPRGAITIVSGRTGRSKRVEVAGLTSDDVERRLLASPSQPPEGSLR